MSKALAAPLSISSAKTVLTFLAALAMVFAIGMRQADAAKYAAIVVDANTGKTLFASSADAARYPASLTKMMTLYMVFEALSTGKLKKTTPIKFSVQASAKPPTKLGVKAGGSVSVETIIYSLVTKSANDAAAAVAEHLGGSEAGFARIMTQKARQLGMKNTVFRNASGLPDSAQHSTARDMAVLGIALREHYPQYYKYFSTRSFTFGKHRMANHNRLLGRVKGVDGIKTGYTRASGFNLVSSVRSGDRSIVAVVMGGQSGRSRDNHMAELIKKYLPNASTRDRGALVAKVSPSEFISAGEAVAAAMVLPKKNAPTPMERPGVAAAAEREPVVQAYAAEPAARAADIDPVSTASTASDAPSGWAVQVGASPSEREARGVLSKVSGSAPRVVTADAGYTVTFEKDGVTYFRARFGGFSSKSAAWNACGALKKKKIDCYAVLQ
ncbi:MAG: D-alanyl-D-alanine carboxypeptidase [Rhizobiaceae bacterium]